MDRSPRRDRYSRRTISDQGPQQHLWAHGWWSKRTVKRTSAPTVSNLGCSMRRAVFLRTRRSWPVEPRYKRR
ncbi:hypothetical protein Hamer_G023072 [Homarus americanus]|uniref:Uncharacterized protein n=1 Tax=Homarus americanus TaxID=6706 RepID=A0A8J5N4T7_HOMAM|nr:hypothetical protein Hamer_G023072 [Homarus americanus]